MSTAENYLFIFIVGMSLWCVVVVVCCCCCGVVFVSFVGVFVLGAGD